MSSNHASSYANKEELAKLARLIGVHAPYDGTFELRIPGVYAIRRSGANTQVTHAIHRSAVCIVAQGAKTVMVGEDVFHYEESQIAVYSVDVPVAAQITRASGAAPYLTLRIDLEPLKVAELAAKVFPSGLPQPRDHRALHIGKADVRIIDAATRLLESMAQRTEGELLAPSSSMRF